MLTNAKSEMPNFRDKKLLIVWTFILGCQPFDVDMLTEKNAVFSDDETFCNYCDGSCAGLCTDCSGM